MNMRIASVGRSGFLMSVLGLLMGGCSTPGTDWDTRIGVYTAEQVMAEMARDADQADENNPRHMARMMRKLFDGTGMQLGPGMEEAIRRMEAGDDPDKIEEEMGDLLAGEEELPFAAGGGAAGLRALRRKLKPPSVDRTLYEL